MIINNNIKKEIEDFALANKPDEVCGFVLSNNGEYSVFKCQNISYSKKNHCILNPFDYIRASKLGKIVAHFHSQEDKNASLLDNINAFNHQIHSIIYSWKFKKFSLIEPTLEPYLNKDYESGVSDCYSLVRDYFKKELNIQLNDYNRNEEWWNENPNLIVDNFKKELGIEVNIQDIKKNDLIVFNIFGVSRHFAIYLGGDFILHHPRNEKSVINELNDKLKKRVSLVIRHKDLF